MSRSTIPIIIVLFPLLSFGQSSKLRQPLVYDVSKNCEFLWKLHHETTDQFQFTDLCSDSAIVFAQYCAAHPNDKSSPILVNALRQEKNDEVLFALSQQENTLFENWIDSYANDQKTSDTTIGWIGKCIRSEKDAMEFQKFIDHRNGYSLGLYFAMRNGYFFDFWTSDLIQIISEKIRQSASTTDVCRAIKAIPSQHYPQHILDSLANISPLGHWNNRMAIQMIGKAKSKKAIETILKIALMEGQQTSLVIECLLQLLRQSNFDARELEPLLNHHNKEIVELTIDCIVKQR